MDRPDTWSIAAHSEGRPDGDLARLIAGGDEGAFMAAYDAHASLIFGVVARLLSDREAAAEVVQETYVTLWQRAAQYRPEAGSLRTWLMRIARNRALDRLRAEARRPRLAQVPTSTSPDRGSLSGAASAVETDDEPSRSLERRWTQAVVRMAMAGIPGDERVVLLLAYDEGLSQSQIATRLDLPVGTVKSRTRRAMGRLRETLGDVPDLIDGKMREASDGTR